MICVSIATAEWCDTTWDLLVFLGCGLNAVLVLVSPHLESCFASISGHLNPHFYFVTHSGGSCCFGFYARRGDLTLLFGFAISSM